jgi:Baseplate J-like protein
MADLTPTDILLPPTSDEIKQSLIEGLQVIPGNPIDDWHSGGVTRTVVELERLTDEDLMQAALPAMLGQAAVDFPGTTSPWLTLSAAQLYSRTRVAAVTAVQTETLTCDGSHGPYTITAGQLWFRSATTGNRWVNTTGGTLNTSGTLAIQIQAEGPGATYNDPAGTIRTMLIPLAGVTAVNTATDFSPIVPGTNSTGTLAASRTTVGVAPTAATFLIRIDSSGQVAAGAWSYSVDGGRTYRSAGAIATTDLVLASGGASGTRVTFTNGAASPSFVAGDLFSFTTPGSSFVTVGKDQESDATLIARCQARWPDLAVLPTQSRYLKWAKAASAEVKRVRLEEDATYLGKLYVTLAGVAGPVSGGAVTAVQNYINPRAPIGRIIEARNSSAVEILGAGVVTVAAAKLAAIQADAQARWQATLFAADIGQVMRVSDLERAVMDAGAIDFTGAQLNGGGNVTLASTKVPVLPAATPLLANQLTWQAI